MARAKDRFHTRKTCSGLCSFFVQLMLFKTEWGTFFLEVVCVMFLGSFWSNMMYFLPVVCFWYVVMLATLITTQHLSENWRAVCLMYASEMVVDLGCVQCNYRHIGRSGEVIAKIKWKESLGNMYQMSPAQISCCCLLMSLVYIICSSAWLKILPLCIVQCRSGILPQPAVTWMGWELSCVWLA